MDIIGKLEVLNVVDILQMLSMTKRNGALILRSAKREGHIYIKDGRVVDANLERWRGISAVNQILTWKDGSFEFHEGTKNPGETINLGTDNLLLEGLRRLDEWRHLQRGGRGRVERLCFSASSLDPALQQVLNENEKKLLSLFDGRRNLSEVAKTGNLPPEGARQMALELFLAGALETEEAANMEVEIPTVQKKEDSTHQELQEIIDYLKKL